MPMSVVNRPSIWVREKEKTAVTGLPRPRWVRPDRNLLIFAGLAAAYLLPFMWLYNAGLLEVDAVRVLHGEVFGRDFFEVMTPGTFYWNAAFMKVFGANYLGARACFFVTSLGTATCMYLLARRIMDAYAWLPPLLLAATYRAWPFASHHTDSNFFALLAVVCAVYAYERQSRVAWMVGGVLTAVTGLTLQPKGALLLLAILLWMLAMRSRRALPLSAAILYVAGVAVAGGTAVFYFWSQGALRAVYDATVLWPLRHYAGVNQVRYGADTFVYWTEFLHTKSGTLILGWLAPIVTVPFLMVDAMPIPAVLAVAVKWRSGPRPYLLLYWLSGAALWLAEIHRVDTAHLAIGSSVWMILACYFVGCLPGRLGQYSMQILAICTVAVAAINLTMMAAAHPLKTRAGTMLSIKSVPGIRYLEAHTRPGDYIFAYPYIPQYYFLTATRNPTRYSLLIYNYNTEHQFQRAIHELDRHRVKYVIWKTDMRELDRILPGCTRKPSYGFIMDDYLHSHYHEVKAFSNGMQIWERNGDA